LHTSENDEEAAIVPGQEACKEWKIAMMQYLLQKVQITLS